MLIFKIVKDKTVLSGFSDEEEEVLKKQLFDQGYFVFLIREANEEELSFIQKFNNNIEQDDTDN